MKPAAFQQIALAAVLISATTAAFAQNPGAVDQVDATQQRRNFQQSGQLLYDQGEVAPELYPGESDDIGPQSVLAAKSPRTWFEGTADSQYYYTDNAFYDHSGRVASGVLVSSVEFALAPSAYKLGGGESTPRIGFLQQWFDYFQYESHSPNLNSMDFNAQTVFAEERWTYHDWIFGAGFDYTRLLSTANYRQFYSEYVPRWEVTRLFHIGKKQTFAVGYHGYYHFTDASEISLLPDPGFFDRFDQLLLASYSWEVAPNLVLQPYYSFRYTHYTAIDREDYLNSVGVGIDYFFGNYVSARAFVGYDQRSSSISSAEYHQFDAGGGLNLTVKF